MTDQELNNIVDLLDSLPCTDKWRAEIAVLARSGCVWGVTYVSDDRKVCGRFATCATFDDADFVAQAPKIIRKLLDEIQFLRGQLADLCDDSKAVAEVVRLQNELKSLTASHTNTEDSDSHPGSLARLPDRIG